MCVQNHRCHAGSTSRKCVRKLHTCCMTDIYFLDLKAMNDDFINSYVKLADGEKDPRNLIITFAIDRVLLIEFDVTKHYEVRL